MKGILPDQFELSANEPQDGRSSSEPPTSETPILRSATGRTDGRFQEEQRFICWCLFSWKFKIMKRREVLIGVRVEVSVLWFLESSSKSGRLDGENLWRSSSFSTDYQLESGLNFDWTILNRFIAALCPKISSIFSSVHLLIDLKKSLSTA